MRAREESYEFNTFMKKDILKSNNITKDDSKKKETLDILEEYARLNLRKKEGDTPNRPIYNIQFNVPEYSFQKRIYISKDKPIKFHEKAYVVKLDQSILGEINSNQTSIDFEILMAMFEKDELNEINIKDLLNIDEDNIENTKNKLKNIIRYVNKCNCPDNNEKNKVLSSLNDLLNQFDKNKDNINNILSNIENINKINYGYNETKVVFSK